MKRTGLFRLASLRSIFWIVAAVLLTLNLVADDELLRGGGMEGPFAGGLAAGWVKNCYGSNDVVFAGETSDVHGGKSAQRVTCTRFDGGGVQFHSARVAVEKGKPYTLRLWMKGYVASPVYVGVRKHNAPYTGYLKRFCRLKNEWRPYVLIGEASDSDNDCGVYIMFAGAGTLLVADVSLRPGIHEDSAAATGMTPVKGNRIYNSGFEAGPEGWTPTDGFVVDSTNAHSGACSARIGETTLPSLTLPLNRPLPPKTRPRTTPVGIECRPFPVRAGQRYTFSAWIKAAEPDTRVTLRFFEWADEGGDSPSNRNERKATVRATTEWARYQVSGIALPNLWEDYVARIVPSGTVWVDDVQMEEGDASDYQAAHPIEAGAETSTRWCRVGENVKVTARVASQPTPGDVTLRYTLEDLWSRPVTTVSHVVKPGAPDDATFNPRRPGLYRVRVQANDSPATGEVWFGVFPKRDRKLRPDSPFGTHVTDTVATGQMVPLERRLGQVAGISEMTSASTGDGRSVNIQVNLSNKVDNAASDLTAVTLPEPTNTLLASAAMGARWVRLHDFGDFCHWRVVEPEKGHFVWRDAEINDLRQRGFTLLANLGHPPLWAGRADPNRKDSGDWTNAAPRDPAEWEEYVFRTVEHFRDRIRLWEIWNEPNWKTFFSGTPEEYAELQKIAWRAIKRADPKAVVIGGCFAPSDEKWTQRVLAQDAMSFMDALSYHVYWSPPMTEPAAPGQMPVITQQVQRYVELMREHGAVKPIYMSEGGIRCPPFASWLPKEGFSRGAAFGSHSGATVNLTGLDAACGLVRGMVQMLSAGVAGIGYYYTGGVRGAMPWFSTMANGYYVLMDFDGRPKPTMMAYSALEQQLDGAKPVRSIEREGLTIHLFAKGRGSIAVVWSEQARRLSVEGASVLDLMGNPDSELSLRPREPVYVSAPRLTPAQLEERLK